MSKFVKPFRMGDVVKLGKREHIIYEAKLDGKSFEYSTDISAWHSHSEFTLVRECDAKSIQKLRESEEKISG